MARDTDRKCVSEAIRLSNGAWSIDWHGTGADGATWAVIVNVIDHEKLQVRYSKAGRIAAANHTLYDPGTARAVSCNDITTRKRKRVLAIIEGKR